MYTPGPQQGTFLALSIETQKTGRAEETMMGDRFIYKESSS